MIPNGGSSVMATRREPPHSLDFFPTPPFGTRALCEHVLRTRFDLRQMTCLEPAAGEGHMAEVLREYFKRVHASDVFDYGKGYAVGAFVANRLGLVDDLSRCPFAPDWVITNPPFNLAEAFVERALAEANVGVAILVRTSWLETSERYHKIFSVTPPTTVAIFVERVAMVKGRWDHNASTATSYAWVIWDKFKASTETAFIWIPPGCKDTLTKPSDFQKFTAAAPDMFEEATTQ
ncbi:MAG: SAM-dependent DNA methyltransferase [Hyphomicrobiaceae bacterium]|nr:SAM-dependent DNA methyltransferase [Hyphomicrobiaceae bacterium]